MTAASSLEDFSGNSAMRNRMERDNKESTKKTIAIVSKQLNKKSKFSTSYY